MTRYLLSRVMGMLVVMALVAVIVFVLTRAASGDPIAVLLGDQATAEDIASAQKLYGLDKPLPVQFGYWLKELSHGNLGQSIFLQRPVTQALWELYNPAQLEVLYRAHLINNGTAEELAALEAAVEAAADTRPTPDEGMTR